MFCYSYGYFSGKDKKIEVWGKGHGSSGRALASL
jgi:hypothetical protein